MRQWYAVQCKPAQDARAEAHLHNQQFKVFRPLARIRKRCRGQMKDVIESLFPRYLFVHLDNAIENWAPIRSTRGVAGLVKFRDEPAVVPAAIVDDLQRRSDAEHCVALSPVDYQPNQRIRITDGPFNGYEGIFHARRGADRIIILLNVMQQPQHLVIPDSIVEPA